MAVPKFKLAITISRFTRRGWDFVLSIGLNVPTLQPTLILIDDVSLA